MVRCLPVVDFYMRSSKVSNGQHIDDPVLRVQTVRAPINNGDLGIVLAQQVINLRLVQIITITLPRKQSGHPNVTEVLAHLL